MLSTQKTITIIEFNFALTEQCREVYTERRGTITSSFYSSDYSSKSICSYVIQPDGATRIKLRAISFSMNCGEDRLTIYSGTEINILRTLFDRYTCILCFWFSRLLCLHFCIGLFILTYHNIQCNNCLVEIEQGISEFKGLSEHVDISQITSYK